MTRSAGPLLGCALALLNAQANSASGVPPHRQRHIDEADQPVVPIEPQPPATNPPTADDICRTLERAAAENALPVEFFARVIWQESRFNARAVRSQRAASGIAQFMPQTASWHGLADPFDPIEALRHSAGYLLELRDRFGNLGLAAAAYNAGPGRVSAWLASHHPLPDETRNYVAIVTGWTADRCIGVPLRRRRRTPRLRRAYPVLGSPISSSAPKEEAKRIAAYIPRWGIWLAAHLVESKALIFAR